MNKFLKSLLLVLLLFVSVTNSKAVIRFVTPSGAGLMNGTSWLNAFPGTSLQNAVNISGSGDEVWVMAGTYFTTPTNNRNISFSMKNGVTVYGSFAGTETLLNQRINSCGPNSILSGEIGAAGIFDNSYHVISNINLDSTAVIDGFEIRGANDNRPATITNGLGGGIYNNGGYGGGICSPVIRNCLIRNNQAVFGGGIFNSGHTGGNSNPLILNCIITENNALDGGGGVDNFGLGGNASPALVNTLVYSNTAVTAGGMYCWGGNVNGNSNPLILNCVFANNRAIGGNAGGIICDNSNSSGGGNSGASNVIIKNSVFWGNTVTGSGPQFFIKGTGTFNATYSDVDLTNQNFPHIISGTGTGNINSDPFFVSIINGRGADNCWFTEDDGLSFQNISPCINSGNNTGVVMTDILSNSRIVNAVVDMGAYEFSPAAKTLNLSLFVEGFYNPTLNISVTDTLRVNLRSSSSPYNSIDSAVSYFNDTGFAVLYYNNAVDSTDYYIHIRHRNSVETWSSDTLIFSGGILNYDLTDMQSRAFGSNQIQIDTSPLRFAVYSGDVNQDGTVDLSDGSLIDNDAFNFVSGYLPTDLNGDGFIDVADAVFADNNGFNFVGKITP
ncbi:MAG: choice-of-anchor Q domain-containing protein [Ignavibacteria bacterium]